jgi:hypothetical protein
MMPPETSMTAHDLPHITVCNPAGTPVAAPKPLALRLETLRGMRIALIDNGKEFSADVLRGVTTVLNREFGVKELRVWDKQFPAKGAPFIAELAGWCDAIITGVGH